MVTESLLMKLPLINHEIYLRVNVDAYIARLGKISNAERNGLSNYSLYGKLVYEVVLIYLAKKTCYIVQITGS